MSKDTPKKNPNYMTMKTVELDELMKANGLDRKDYETTSEAGTVSLNRKLLNNVLKAIDLATGRARAAMVDLPDEPIKDHEPTVKLHKGLSGMMVKITFYNNDENDLPYVQLALNGIALMVPREVETWIPKEFVDGVLLSAIATAMKMETYRNQRGETKIRYIPKQVQRVQYAVKDIKHIDVLKKEFDEKNKK